MRELHSTRVQQKEAVQHLLELFWVPPLYLLAVDLPLLLLFQGNFLSVLQLRLLLFDLDHHVHVLGLHWQRQHVGFLIVGSFLDASAPSVLPLAPSPRLVFSGHSWETSLPLASVVLATLHLFGSSVTVPTTLVLTAHLNTGLILLLVVLLS
mmetsp:Transcript_22544/g.21708  ORF Transcript_22544/g.21708 Transcript_22544/m.21708 type:complete len:152 (+) Transcript_22544:1560-2015(+)